MIHCISCCTYLFFIMFILLQYGAQKICQIMCYILITSLIVIKLLKIEINIYNATLAVNFFTRY